MSSDPKKFTRPPSTRSDTTSPNLYVANCGPAVGVPHPDVASAFATFGEVVEVHAADGSGARVIVCYADTSSSRAALEAWSGKPCPVLGGRVLHIRYSVAQQPRKISDSVLVSSEASELGIPGIYLLHDFVSSEDEQKLLAEVDANPWKNLAKRRVQHYGYEFLYETSNVDAKQFLGELPSFVSPILKRLPLFPKIKTADENIVNQLTVNEYTPGVGLAPHVDTHSAFDENIFSLSLASSCIMEFRKYPQELVPPLSSTVADFNGENCGWCSNFERKAIFLPPRSMLLMSGEGRYAWHHYIPHHKVDLVDGIIIRRGPRRVSFTFRKIRTGPCCCKYAEYCDSQGKMSVRTGG